jgi:hypothetical protein
MHHHKSGLPRPSSRNSVRQSSLALEKTTMDTQGQSSTPAHISSLFSSLHDPVASSILPLSARRLRARMRCYSPRSVNSSSNSSAVSSPTGGAASTSTPSSSATGVRAPIYSNWVFVTSAEVLARAGESDEEGDLPPPPSSQNGEAAAAVAAIGVTPPLPGKGAWTKRQYRIESEKLRGKEWVFR